ncbi:tetratricopeptide repeat protein [Streptacidiphilus jiangxiensis]|uniref:Tetratricopeptide (TPR) repeat n=1 Tax=Streptacidiphilus jiangxiensis TaxID=235985 RepID=A0A1H7Y1V8_STRJI|nr:tetratricopeptide repeat protein [Streptacidiphilus jiangxiensis]SEM39327.1 Tetratricopeptide (TPR) repeat [Streptacidiphilus jiangxiensis]
MQPRSAKADPQDELAARLRLLQELSGLGLRALARDTGLSSSSLSRYLSGQTVPPWPAVIALCRLVKRDPRPLRPLWEQAQNPLPAPPRSSRQVHFPPRNDLPRDVPDFTGREDQLAAVLDAVEDSRIVALDGMAGVGKTCLAVHAAHHLAADYPDAQLYLDLHGFTEGRDPLDADPALRSLLTALDVPSEKVPIEGVEQLAACWRAELARRKAVVVLDNVADAEHVRPLLPGAGPSVVLITSRNRLVGLDEVPPVSLDVLSAEESAELLARASGEPAGPEGRLARDPQAAAEVLRLCGRLPLALRLAGARLRHRPGWTVGILVERMAEGVDEFDTAFAMSVRQLDRATGRFFRLLGLLPGSSFDEHLAAALAQVPVRSARAMLEDLLDAHLVQQPTAGRYRMHDLVHQHARRACEQQDAAADRARALGRLLDYYVHAAAAADAAMPFLARSRAVTAGEAPQQLPDFAGKEAAFAWYATEYENLIAVFETAMAIGADVHACELPRFMRAFFARRCGTTHLNFLFERSLVAAQRLGDPHQLAEAHSDLGFARYNAGRMTEAADSYASAAVLVAETGDVWSQAELTMRRGFLRWDEGDVDEPLELFREAGRLYEAAGCPTGTAHATAYEAWALLQLGRTEEAASMARETLAVPHPDPSWPPALTARITLGVAIAHEQPEAAEDHLRQALAAARADGHRHNEAWGLNCLGVALRRMGRYEEALAAHREAFALLEELFEEHWKIHFLNGYAETCSLAGLPDQALALYREALDLAPKLGYRHEEAAARAGIAALTQTPE